MPLVVPNEGEPTLLRLMLVAALIADEPFLLHLYSNNYDPVKDSVLGDFMEASFSGYDTIQLDRDTWTYPVEIAGIANTTYGVTFLQWLATSGTQDIYGYYVTDLAETICIWAEKLATPVTVSASVPVVLLPVMRLHSEVEP